MFDKLYKTLIKITNDKLLHFFCGSIIGFFLVLFFSWVGILLTLKIAVLKEAIDFIFYDIIEGDKKYKYKESVIDIIYTVVPSILFYIITLIY